MLYEAAFLYRSGALECGVQFDAATDADAVALAKRMAFERKAQLFSLREQCGDSATRIVHWMMDYRGRK